MTDDGPTSPHRPRTHGWPYPFRQREWSEIAAFLDGIAAENAEFRHMSDIVHSVINSRSSDLLAACTSMHDLIVVPTPFPEPPYGVVAVRSPSSLTHPKNGTVLIQHLSVTGHNDEIARPVAEAVPLFWRFMIEKYGVRPVTPPDEA
ncbi:MAG TPA: hypothetical protein VFL59_12505 [Candidatus Nanopelagicales bacterium]|nr:hypothetical protein [Candidatus Nanopelagicales bacterium]